MGLFDIFRGKSSNTDPQQELIGKIIRRYFNSSREKLQADVNDLLKITGFDISNEQMSALILCILGYHGVNANWSEKILNQLKQSCSSKLPDVELKWLFDYCDLHYIHKNPGKEFLLLSEMAGRQIGMPAPHNFFSEKNADNSQKVSTSFIKSSIEDLKENFDFNESFKKHTLTLMMLRPGVTFKYFSQEKLDVPLWIYDGNLYCEQDERIHGASAFVWLMQKYPQKKDFCWTLDFLNRQYMDLWPQASKNPNVLINEIKHNLPDFKLGNDPESVKASIQCAWIDLQSILRFIEFCTDNSASVLFSTKVVNNLRECSSIEELVRLFLSDFNVTGKGIIKEKEAPTPQLSEEDKRREELAKKALELIKIEEKTREAEEKSRPQNDTKDPVIIASWSFMDFVRSHGNPKLTQPRKYVNSLTGESFTARFVAFEHPTEKDEKGRKRVIFVGFSSSLGELTAEEIAAQKDNLVVVQYENGNYGLKSRQDNVTTINVVTNKLTTEATEEDFANAFTDEYGVKYSADKTRILKAPLDLEEYTIKEGTKVICSFAFYDSSSVKGNISCISIPNSVEAIGDCAFSGCNKLKSFKFPDNIKSIGKQAFLGCDLSSIIIPANLESIGSGAFDEMTNLNKIVIDKRNMYYDSRNDCNAIIETASNTLIKGCMTTFIPDSISKIGNGAFSYCNKLTSIIIPNSVTSIGEWAFYGCI